MKYLCIGMSLSDAQKKMIQDRGGRILSGYYGSQAILDGLDSQGIVVDSINSFNHISSSVLKKIEEDTWSRTGKSHDYSIGYKNRKYTQHIEREYRLIKAAKDWAVKNGDDEAVVFVYNMHTPFMAAADAVKKINPKTKIVQIIPDMPQYMDLSPSRLKKVLKKIDWFQIKHFMKNIDKYVLYSKPMADFLKLPDNKWMVMEGIFNENLQQNSVTKNDNTVSVMYSGLLELNFGIPELLDAMKFLPENYELWITGNGNAVGMIKKRASDDKRIKLLGYLPSREDLLNKQAEATMLISTRKDSEIASKFCFPSKLFEYMVSGNPVISCRLGGIPDEYFDYLIELPSVTPKDIAETIKNVMSMSVEERNKIGEAQKRFVTEEKNKYAQGKKLLDFAVDTRDTAIVYK